jgi:hypothetical protein
MVAVEILSVSSCARCARGQGCGAGLFNLGMAPVRLHCLAQCQVTAGDQVTVEFEPGDSRWLWLVAGAYGLPTLGLVAGAVTAGVWLTAAAPPLLHLPWLPAWLSVTQPLPSGLRDLVQGVMAFVGLSGGVLAWRTMAPALLPRLEKGLCLQSGRIVAVKPHQP